MAGTVDHVILVGVPEPDSDTETGRRALRYLMNVTNLGRDRIFFSAVGTSPVDILRENFILDKSEKYDYRIGNTICIGTEGVGTEYRHTLNRLKRVEITVKTGYQDVNLEELTEVEMQEWFDTGRYTPRVRSSKTETGGDPDDLLGSLLDDDDTPAPEPEADPDRAPEPAPRATTAPEEGVLDYKSVFPEPDDDDFDTFMSSLDGEKAAPAADTAGLSETTSETTTEDSAGFDMLGDDPEPEVPTPPRPTARPTPPSPEPTRTPPPRPQPTPGPDPQEGLPEDRRDPRRMDDSRPDEIESDDHLARIRADRERKQRQLAEARAEADSRRAASGPSWAADEQGEAGNAMYRQTDSMVTNDFREDGTRKTYREHLSGDDHKAQLVQENQWDKFGDLKHLGDPGPGDDIRYVSQGQGRIIMCTSGKGGVGKSLVASGLAMALSLARAKELSDNPGASQARTWLIESDYNSPQLAVSYGTGSRNLGNVADIISSGGKGIDNARVRQAIEDNIHVDPDSGVHVLACPTLSSRHSSAEMPLAILLAVKYASDQGDDVIIDHGNLTSGTYSELDQVLSMTMAHRVVLVANMGCIPETQSTLSVLCSRERGSVVKARPVQSVSVVLNVAKEEQFLLAQKKLAPFEIINILPPIDSLRPENSLSGETTLVSAPKEVQKAVIDRCGIMLTRLGYESVRKYFGVKTRFNAPKKSGKKSILRQVADFIARE